MNKRITILCVAILTPVALFAIDFGPVLNPFGPVNGGFAISDGPRYDGLIDGLAAESQAELYYSFDEYKWYGIGEDITFFDLEDEQKNENPRSSIMVELELAQTLAGDMTFDRWALELVATLEGGYYWPEKVVSADWDQLWIPDERTSFGQGSLGGLDEHVHGTGTIELTVKAFDREIFPNAKLDLRGWVSLNGGRSLVHDLWWVYPDGGLFAKGLYGVVPDYFQLFGWAGLSSSWSVDQGQLPLYAYQRPYSIGAAFPFRNNTSHWVAGLGIESRFLHIRWSFPSAISAGARAFYGAVGHGTGLDQLADHIRHTLGGGLRVRLEHFDLSADLGISSWTDPASGDFTSPGFYFELTKAY